MQLFPAVLLPRAVFIVGLGAWEKWEQQQLKEIPAETRVWTLCRLWRFKSLLVLNVVKTFENFSRLCASAGRLRFCLSPNNFKHTFQSESWFSVRQMCSAKCVFFFGKKVLILRKWCKRKQPCFPVLCPTQISTTFTHFKAREGRKHDTKISSWANTAGSEEQNACPEKSSFFACGRVGVELNSWWEQWHKMKPISFRKY